MAGAQTAWGIDVGVTSLKAIKLRKDGDMVSVEAFEVVEHEKFLSEPDVNRDEIIRTSLNKFLLKNPIRREQVFIGVPGSSTFARFVKLPPVEPKKVPEIVKFEAIQQIPFPLDQVNWDYHTFQSPESPDVEVGIFAMKKELVAQVLANFRSVGMTIHGVQMSPLAIYNAAAFDGMTDGKGTVLIDMGAEHTDLVIMDQGRLWLRTINIGGNHFTDALAKSFKQSFNRAEQLKKTAATSKYQKQIFQAMRPIFADLVAEIQRSIGHYNSGHRDSRLERIIGMGNPFKLPNLQKYLQQELKLEVIRLDSFRKVKSDGKLTAGFNEGILGMTTAYGLAAQGLGFAPIDTNLLPIELARQMMWKNKNPWFIAAAAVVVLSVCGVLIQYKLASNAFEDSQKEVADANTHEIKDAMDQKAKYQALNLAQYQTDKATVDQNMNLAQARTIWPRLNLDILQALPQAKNPTQARIPGTKVVMVTNIYSQYQGAMINFSTKGQSITGESDPTGTAGNAAPTNSGNTFVNPDDPGAGGAAAPVQVVQPAGPNPNLVGPSDRGFLMAITGYAPSTNDEHAVNIVAEYKAALLAIGDVNKTNRPYYFSDSAMNGMEIPSQAPGVNPNTIRGMWGNYTGPFREFYAMGIAGIKPAPKPVEVPGVESTAPPPLNANELGGPVDAFYRNLDNGPKYMFNDFWFTIQLKVHIR